ncbi:hypothetical protein H5S09_05635 [Limosilactobacillus sp. STM2_1]|uniref:Uncharacterized protein n=1 Tax=Limosilactobacillus rudii TaxID=2759755 RepID=A0A7W3UKT4_9LACO|nr:hypothetical protein [Limosilactobacillus rudii]MBB1079371.1 hypothetical protein [Limosilactobacillus rudii]MBB1097417.1 hypothetical protein [Limosilactobacillus rudii]MCD7134526.1 hypothetical protein [Limosilactobacillus rudii]
MNKVFMTGYYQGVVETAPATLSAAKVTQLAVAMTILHLRHANTNITSIHDFLVTDLHVDKRLVNKYINLNADQLETAQAEVLALAFKK